MNKALRRKIPLLLYHQLIDNDVDLNRVPVSDRPYYLRKADFQAQMKYLYYNQFQAIPLSQLIEHQKNRADLPPKPIILTFDDGDLSNYSIAYPILRKYGFTAAFFITSRVGLAKLNTDLFSLPRLAIKEGYHLKFFQA